jgi:hypothetical protein
MERIDGVKLGQIWDFVKQDADGRRALNKLARAGFDIRGLPVGGGTLTWADHIAGLPLVSNRTSSRRIHGGAELKQYAPLLGVLRELSSAIDDSFCEVVVVRPSGSSRLEKLDLRQEVKRTAEFLDSFMNWHWYVRHVNVRNYLIAGLRWEIRERTQKPHDAELSTLIDAAYRGAGHKDGLYVDTTALDRMEKREKESRVKAHMRLHSRAGRDSKKSTSIQQYW